MPKLSHEAIVHLVRAAPAAIVELLAAELGLDRSRVQAASITATEFVDLNFAEYRADAMIVLGDPERPGAALVVEAQGEADPRKRRTWKVYVAGAAARHDCPVALVIVALRPEVAAWCSQPIDFGFGRGHLLPVVLGPRQIPVITDLDAARRCPELAVLSAVAHGDEPGAEHIALAALLASRDLDGEARIFYPDFVLAALGDIARKALEQLMPSAKRYEFQSDFARKYYAEGIAKGEAKGEARGQATMLLKLLRLKGLELSPELQAEVESCEDPAQLDAWAGRLLDARSLADVFDPR